MSPSSHKHLWFLPCPYSCCMLLFIPPTCQEMDLFCVFPFLSMCSCVHPILLNLPVPIYFRYCWYDRSLMRVQGKMMLT